MMVSGLLVALGFIIGTILGSLSLALADRSLSNKSFWGRSYCPFCKAELRWYDLFPIFSYLTVKGKCRYCHKKISLDYLLVEIIMGLLIGYLFYQEFHNLNLLCHPELVSGSLQQILEQVQNDISCVSSLNQFEIISFVFQLLFKTFFITVLAIVTITDFKETLIPDRVMLPAIVISTVALFAFTIYRVWYLYFYLSQSLLGKLLLPPNNDYFRRHVLMATEPLFSSLLTALGLAGFFLSLIIITKGRGMGGGDVKLGAFMGLGLGFPNGVLALTLSFLIGAVVALGLIISGKKHFGQNIPFGPFLVVGSLIALFWGDGLIRWYLSLSGS